jgi:hypothetical protein
MTVDDIPGYKEALAAEREVRQLPFLPVPELICGVPVRPLTPRMHLGLESSGSVFVCGGMSDEVEVVRFLWFVSTDYRWPSDSPFRCVRALDRAINSFRQHRFIRRNRRIKFGPAVECIRRYMDEAYADGPGSPGNIPEYWSWCAGLVDCFGIAYGWTSDEVINTPLKVLLQLRKIIRKRADPSEVQFNASDRIKGRWLAEQNQHGN